MSCLSCKCRWFEFTVDPKSHFVENLNLRIAYPHLWNSICICIIVSWYWLIVKLNQHVIKRADCFPQFSSLLSNWLANAVPSILFLSRGMFLLCLCTKDFQTISWIDKEPMKNNCANFFIFAFAFLGFPSISAPVSGKKLQRRCKTTTALAPSRPTRE